MEFGFFPPPSRFGGYTHLPKEGEEGTLGCYAFDTCAQNHQPPSAPQRLVGPSLWRRSLSPCGSVRAAALHDIAPCGKSGSRG